MLKLLKSHVLKLSKDTEPTALLLVPLASYPPTSKDTPFPLFQDSQSHTLNQFLAPEHYMSFFISFQLVAEVLKWYITSAIT